MNESGVTKAMIFLVVIGAAIIGVGIGLMSMTENNFIGMGFFFAGAMLIVIPMMRKKY